MGRTLGKDLILITNHTMRLYALALLTLLLAGCDKAQEPGNTAEGPTGIQETFDDSPGLIRSEIVNPAGRLVTIGYWLNGKKEGAWADYTEDERVYRLTTYVGGKKEGIYLEFNTDNRLIKRCYYHNDQRHGKYVEYSPMQLKEERFYSYGKLEGISRVYFPNGKLMEEGYYVDGLREGVSKWYDRDGNLTLEYMYHKGELVKK